MNGEDVSQVWSGPYRMIDADTDAAAIIEECNRYSNPSMGR